MRYICTSIVATLALAGTSFAETINVPADYLSIQDAIDASANGDIVRLAAGTYFEHELKLNGKAITLEGSLDGKGELASTINAENHSWIIKCNDGEAADTIIRNLVLENGYAVGSGAGLIIIDASPGIENVTIQHCQSQSGSALYTYNSGSVISNVTMQNCGTTYGIGGAARLWHSSQLTLDNCLIENNTAREGAGIYATYGTLTVSNTTILNNISAANDTISKGGGLLIENMSLYMNGCTIKDNSNRYGGGIYAEDCDIVEMTDCDVVSNQATGIGGGVNMNFCDEVAFSACDFVSNSAETGGGARLFYCETNFSECFFGTNDAPTAGSAAAIAGGDTNIVGTIVRENYTNEWSEAGALHVFYNATVNYSSCMIADNGAFGITLSSGTANFTGTAVCGHSLSQIEGDWNDDGNNCISESCTDSDSDGTIDCFDECPNDPYKIEPGACGCGSPDTDSDSDGIADCIDVCPNDAEDDIDGDGVCGDVDAFPNDPNEWADSDGDGLGDNEDNYFENYAHGACCVSSGCHNLTETACTGMGGTWLGEGGSCDDCPASCMGDTDGNGVVNIEDLLNLIGAWGACP